MNLAFVLKRPIITEKSNRQLAEERKYAFEVDIRATKKQIKEAVEKYFKVRVENIGTVILKGKKKNLGRRRKEIQKMNWKRAMVQLAEGNKIDAFELPTEEKGKK